mgnify:FL=1
MAEIEVNKYNDFVVDKETGVTIDIGIPLPEDRRANVKYPFGNMEVGDSFFVQVAAGDRLKNRLSQASRTFGKRQDPERKYILRTRLENEISGVRVWRTE